MKAEDLVDQLDAEILDVTRRLAFWHEQLRLQSGTEFADYVAAIIAGYEAQLELLHVTGAAIDA